MFIFIKRINVILCFWSCVSPLYTYTQSFLYNIIQSHVIESGLFSPPHSYLGRSLYRCTNGCGWKENCWCVSVFAEYACVECLMTHSVHFFGCVFGVLVGGDVSESDILLLCALLVAHFSLHVEANHHLVDHHTDDGAKERGKDGHQEPAVSSP